MSEPTEKPHSTDTMTRALRWIVGITVGIFVLTISATGAMYVLSPSVIRNPTQTHFHFRLDLIVDGKPVNFGEDKYQTTFTSDNCSALLTKQPIHFHDNENQFVHIHWAGMTGGLVLKNYGWNVIGGLGNTLGWRFDQGLAHIIRVPIHSNSLPTRQAGDNYYVYVGDATKYESRSWQSFTNETLPTFFHTSVSSHEEESSADEEKLAQLNHVIGSVVIFVQKDKPTDAQVKAQFKALLPLPQSQCAG